MKNRLRAIISDIAANLAVYFVVLGGVLFSKFGPPLMQFFTADTPLPFTRMTILQVGLAFVIAFAVMVYHEQHGMNVADAAQLTANRIAKKKHLLPRLGTAFSWGVTWATVIGAVIHNQG